MDAKQSYLDTLINILTTEFSTTELRPLGYRLFGIELRSDRTHAEQAADLVKRLDLNQRIPDLIQVGQKIHPHLQWPLPPWLLDNVRQTERNQAYAEAIKQWEYIQTLNPPGLNVAQEIQRLTEKVTQIKKITDLKRQLAQRKLEIAAIYLPVAARLKRMEKEGVDEEAEIILDMVEEFLTGENSVAEFTAFWSSVVEVHPHFKFLGQVNYRALAERLQRGDIVILLGSEIPALSNPTLPNCAHLVPQLAQCADYPHFQGSFPEICEYMHLNHQFGRSSLCLKLQQLIEPAQSVSISLYQLLAQLPVPLLLITATYDAWLETTFQQYDKKFVLLWHSTQEIGTLFLDYSDQAGIERYSIDKLSGLQLLERGYSVIYKILGRFAVSTTANAQDSLILSERDYLNFVQHQDKLIPDYVIAQLRGRGFWLLGHYPHSWEQRLIIRAILKQRQHEEPALTVHPDPDEFARLYWENRRVKNYPLALPEFVAHLQRHL